MRPITFMSMSRAEVGVGCAVAAVIAARDGGFSTPSAVVGTAPPLLGIGFGIASMMDHSAEASTQPT